MGETTLQEKVLREASFENATRYFVIQTAVVLAVTVVGILLMPIILPIVWIARKIEYERIRCLLLERSLKVHRGWLNRVEKTIPLEKITDLAIAQGPIMRWVGVESLTVETAGQSSSTGSSLVSLVGVRDAREFRDAVLEQKERLRTAETSPSSSAAPPVAAGDAALVEIKNAVLRIEDLLRRRKG
jgi:putative membrane protein